MTHDESFLDIFNFHYPFERYIIQNPKSIGNLYDDAILTEIFVPYIDDSEELIGSDEIYIKIKGEAGTMRFAYFDFEEHIRLNIIRIFYEDFGISEYEYLYIDYDDTYDILKPILDRQKKLIIEKYGECYTKNNYLANFLNL
jgi:hypothetical protein